jgi:hypothetical protein
VPYARALSIGWTAGPSHAPLYARWRGSAIQRWNLRRHPIITAGRALYLNVAPPRTHAVPCRPPWMPPPPSSSLAPFLEPPNHPGTTPRTPWCSYCRLLPNPCAPLAGVEATAAATAGHRHAPPLVAPPPTSENKRALGERAHLPAPLHGRERRRLCRNWPEPRRPHPKGHIARLEVFPGVFL